MPRTSNSEFAGRIWLTCCTISSNAVSSAGRRADDSDVAPTTVSGHSRSVCGVSEIGFSTQWSTHPSVLAAPSPAPDPDATVHPNDDLATSALAISVASSPGTASNARPSFSLTTASQFATRAETPGPGSIAGDGWHEPGAASSGMGYRARLPVPSSTHPSAGHVLERADRALISPTADCPARSQR